MNVLKSVKIKIADYTQLKKFAYAVTQFESDIDIIKGSVPYDAKSIMGVIALDPSTGAYVEIFSDDDDEIARFFETMKEFKV